nr:hypothetical protein [Tanacetum cinerariifolium]
MTMATTIDQQVALDEALVPSTQRLRIGRSNFRIPSDIQSKESTLQVVYDVLRNSPFFKAFLGFIYLNKDKKNRLMRIDELHKFSDGTLTDVRTALDDRLKGIRMQYLPQSIWRKSDKDKIILTKSRNPVKKILLKLNLSDHRSILTDLQVTPTKPVRMTKPYSSHRFIANCFNAGNLKMEVKYLPTTIWRRGDKDRVAAMIQAIDKMLKTRRIMRSLEKFVGGRLYEGDFHMLQRTI